MAGILAAVLDCGTLRWKWRVGPIAGESQARQSPRHGERTRNRQRIRPPRTPEACSWLSRRRARGSTRARARGTARRAAAPPTGSRRLQWRDRAIHLHFPSRCCPTAGASHRPTPPRGRTGIARRQRLRTEGRVMDPDVFVTIAFSAYAVVVVLRVFAVVQAASVRHEGGRNDDAR